MGERADCVGAHGERRAQDRVAFVTGGSRGIGRETVLALARAGHPVAFCYSADADGASETRQAVEADRRQGARGAVPTSPMPGAVDAAFGEIESAFGPVTVLVNNAGITRDGLLVRMTDDNWGAVIDTNLTGAFHTIRRATPAMMKARYGRIVNVSSVERPHRPGRSGELRGGQGRARRAHPQRRPRARPPQHHLPTSSRPDLS